MQAHAQHRPQRSRLSDGGEAGRRQIVLESHCRSSFSLACRWPRRLRTGANASAKSIRLATDGRYRAILLIKRRAQDSRCISRLLISKTAELAGYGAAVKRIWAGGQLTEAKQHGAFVEDIDGRRATALARRDERRGGKA